MTNYYRVRDYGGKFIPRWKKVRLAYWKLFITTWLFLFAYASIWLLFTLINESGTKMPKMTKEAYAGANFASSDKLEVLRGTNMEDSIPYIAEAAKYYDLPVTLYLGVANAESSLNVFRDGCHNPWGIGNNGPVCYESWQQSVDEFSRLIKYYYFAEGKITPEQMRDKYVGKGIGSPQWSKNVRKYYNPKLIIQYE